MEARAYTLINMRLDNFMPCSLKSDFAVKKLRPCEKKSENTHLKKIQNRRVIK